MYTALNEEYIPRRKKLTPLQAGLLTGFLVITSLMATAFGPYPSINDHHDVDVYFQRGEWVNSAVQPYRDVFSEYPQIATWFFALPHIINLERDQLTINLNEAKAGYRQMFSLLMALFLSVTIFLLYAERSDKRWLAFLLLLPASWYFVHNRYDILPALLTLVSLIFLSRRMIYAAFIVLGIATATKWYAIVLLPVFISYLWHTDRKIIFRATACYGITGLLIILPTIIAIGWDGFMIPYRFHLSRGGNAESLFHLIAVALQLLGTPEIIIDTVLQKFFFLLQFTIAGICLFVRIDNWEKVIRWSALSILGFILFAKFYSPQWILWIFPFLILLARSPGEIAGIIILDLITYIYFPIVYYLEDKHHLWFPGLIALKTAVFGLWMLYLLRFEITSLQKGH